MSATIIDGKAFAAGLRARIATGVTAFAAAAGRAPGLAHPALGLDPRRDPVEEQAGMVQGDPRQAEEEQGRQAEQHQRARSGLGYGREV